MSILLILNYIVAIACAAHAVRNGRELYWVIIILSFPVLGSLVYFFVAVYPNLNVGHHASKVGNTFMKAVDPDRDMRRKIDDVATCGSIDNKISLAQECMERGYYDDAIKLYKSSMQGLFQDDLKLGYGLAEAQFAAEHYAEAKSTLENILAKEPNHRMGEARLYLARALEALAENDQAIAQYEQLAHFSGEEARCRHALLLQKLGRHDAAAKLFEEIQANARRAPRHYVKAQREWIDIAEKQTRH